MEIIPTLCHPATAVFCQLLFLKFRREEFLYFSHIIIRLADLYLYMCSEIKIELKNKTVNNSRENKSL